MNDPIKTYTAAGFKLCRIGPNSKSPMGAGWNKEPISPDSILNPGEGLGLLLAPSGIASLDLDDLEAATRFLRAFGVDLEALRNDPASVHVLSGREGRDKLLYRLPFGLTLPTTQVKNKAGMIYELRNADSGGGSVQDVLPVAGHAHPETGKPYEWQGDFTRIPFIPPELLDHWSKCIAEREQSGNSPVDPDPTVTLDMAGDMLATQNPDCDRKTWIDYGMAIQQQFGDAGFAIWNKWSSGATGRNDKGKPIYPGERAAWQQYRSFRTDKPGAKITIRTLCAAALKAHWHDPRPMQQAAAMFGPVPAGEHCSPAAVPDEWPWEEPVDPFDDALPVPKYEPGQGMLPAVYEAFMETNYRFHNLASREPYAGLFDLAVAVHLRPSVRVEETPGAGRSGGFMHSLNEQAAIVGGTTRGKTKTLFHALGAEAGEVLAKWNELEQVRVAKVREAKAAEIRKLFNGDDRRIEKEIAKLNETMIPPTLVHSKFTDKIMVKWCGVNSKADLPTNDVVDEWDNVFGGAAYRADGGNAMTDLWRKAFDNMPYSDESFNSGRLESDRLSANLGYDCTGSDMADWFGYEKALRNGTMARQSLFAPGMTWEGEREPINWTVVQAWRGIQEQLHDLRDLQLFLEDDPEFDAAINEEITIYSQMVDTGHYVEAWLAKSRIRVARCAARRFLVDELAAGRHAALQRGEVTIPRAYRRNAWTFLTQFAWPHQVFVHKTMIAGENYRSAIHAVMRRAYVNWEKKQHFNRDELTNTKRPKSVGRSDDEFIKVLMMGYRWIRPRDTRITFDRRSPWTAGSFDINPKLIELGRKYHDRLHREHAINLGIIQKLVEKKGGI